MGRSSAGGKVDNPSGSKVGKDDDASSASSPSTGHFCCLAVGIALGCAISFALGQSAGEGELSKSVAEFKVTHIAEIQKLKDEVEFYKWNSTTSKKLTQCETELSKSAAAASKSSTTSKKLTQCETDLSKSVAAASNGRVPSELEAAEAKAKHKAEIRKLQKELNATAGVYRRTIKKLTQCEENIITKVRAEFEAQIATAQDLAKVSAEESKAAATELSACERARKSASSAKTPSKSEAVKEASEPDVHSGNLAKQLSACKVEAEQLQKALQSGDAQVQSLRAELSPAAKSKVPKRKSEQEPSVAALQVALENSAANLTSVVRKLSACKVDATDMEKAMTSLEAHSASLQAELRASESACSATSTAAALPQTDCQDTNTRLQASLNACNARIPVLQAELTACEQGRGSATVKAASKVVPQLGQAATKAPSKVVPQQSQGASKVIPQESLASKAVPQGAHAKGSTQVDAWSIQNNMVTAPLSVLSLLANGTIPVMQGTRRIFVEIGSNSHNTVDAEQLEQFQDAFLISFEPLLHHYASLLARKAVADRLQPLGKHHERGLILPFAVAASDGMAELSTAGSSDSCSSLAKPLNFREWSPECANPSLPVAVRTVPVIRLETVLSWLTWNVGGGWPIDYLKLDARGLDMEVLRSAGTHLERVLRVAIPIQGDKCKPMYAGSLGCSESVAAMKEVGYKAAYRRTCDSFEEGSENCYEESWEFVRAGVRPLHYKKLPWGNQCWVGDMSGLKEKCCNKVRQGLIRGCFNHEYTVHRCCAHKWFPGVEVEPDFD